MRVRRVSTYLPGTCAYRWSWRCRSRFGPSSRVPSVSGRACGHTQGMRLRVAIFARVVFVNRCAVRACVRLQRVGQARVCRRGCVPGAFVSACAACVHPCLVTSWRLVVRMRSTIVCPREWFWAKALTRALSTCIVWSFAWLPAGTKAHARGRARDYVCPCVCVCRVQMGTGTSARSVCAHIHVIVAGPAACLPRPRSPLAAHLKASPKCHCRHRTDHSTMRLQDIMNNVRFTDGFLERWRRDFTSYFAPQISLKATVNTSAFFPRALWGASPFPSPS